MKLIPTFSDSHFMGYKTLKEVVELRALYYNATCEKQKKEQADHMLYCHYDLGETGEVQVVLGAFYDRLRV